MTCRLLLSFPIGGNEMDLYAYMQKDKLIGYVAKHYGEPPRLRGIRLMEVESPCEPSESYQMKVFNFHCGKPVIYIHTRCGGYNYQDFGADEWEQNNIETFIEGIDDEFDSTYRDHYFEAVEDDEYRALVAEALAERSK